MYRRILVPLDGSKLAERVLPYARLLAKAQHVPIELLRVFDRLPGVLTNSSGGQGADCSSTAFRNEANEYKYIEQIASSLRGVGVEVTVACREGDPASLIIKEAEQHSNTLIAMSTHGRSGVGRWVFGSVTDKVLHSNMGYMLIVRATSKERRSHSDVKLGAIIVPLDGSDLAEQSLPVASALSQSLGIRVSLVTATSTIEEDMNTISFQEMGVDAGERIPSSEDIAKEMDGDARAYLNKRRETLIQQGVTSIETQLLQGSAAGAIVDLVQETSDNLVVMTTHGRSGMGRWVLGSVTDRVVRESGGPVLVIRSN